MVQRFLVRLLVVILLIGGAPLPAAATGPGPAEHCPGHRFEVLIGPVCDATAGLLRLADHGDGYTHGLDAAPSLGAHAAIDAPPVPPVCTEAPGSYYAHVIYTRPTDRPDQYGPRADEIRTLIARMNGLIGLEAQHHERMSAYRFLCSDYTIVVSNEPLATKASESHFQAIVDQLRARGYNDPTVKYVVWHEHGHCAGGIGHMYHDDRLIEGNWNNGHPNAVSMFGVNYGCTGDAGVLVTMHELAHNMGAVQNSAPNSTGAGHCRDGQDIMCYDDGGAPYDPNVCTDRTWFDCNNDDYYHPDPPTGHYLASHWNLGSPLNRFMVHASFAPIADAGPDQDTRDTDGSGDATLDLDGSGSTGAALTYQWTRDGVVIGTGVAPQVDIPVGTHTITLTVTDDQGRSAEDTLQVTVAPKLAPIADAGPDRSARDADGTGTEPVLLDGSGSSDPEGGSLSYAWTHDGAVVATDAVAEVMLPVGLHTLTLTVTDIGGLTSNDTMQAEILPNRSPRADAGPDRVARDANGSGFEPIFLDGRGSSDPDGPISYSWTRNGAVIATGATALVELPVGAHTITLTVTDEGGLSDTDTLTAGVLPNRPPVAVAPEDLAVIDEAAAGHAAVTFDGRSSHDPDGPIVLYEWLDEAGDAWATGAIVEIALPHGTHEITLRVEDEGGLSDTDTFTVTVIDNRPPVAAFSQTCDGAVCHFDASASSDPDGDPLLYHWTLGDGTTGSKAAFQHAYPGPGRYAVCLTVEDPGEMTDTTCQTVRVIGLFYLADFQSGDASDWSLSGLWHVSGRCGTAATGSHYLGYHTTSVLPFGWGPTCHYQTLSRTQGNAVMRVDLRDASVATLSFETRWVTESTGPELSRDRQHVQVSPVGSPIWYTLAQWDSRDPNRPDWHTRSYALDAFTGSEVEVRFRFDSMTMDANHHPGWYLDDIRVYADAPNG